MQVKGNILLILLIMLLFSSTVLLQLSEDNYLSHLSALHVDNLAAARRALKESFGKISALAEENQACFIMEGSKNNIENFWSANESCKIIASGISVNYVFQNFQREKQENRYLQYTLRVKTKVNSTWLRVVVEPKSGKTVSWVYYF